MADPHVESVRAKLLERSQVGIAKYGVTTKDAGLSARDWLVHLQQELMDACVYIEAAIAVLPPCVACNDTGLVMFGEPAEQHRCTCRVGEYLPGFIPRQPREIDPEADRGY